MVKSTTQRPSLGSMIRNLPLQRLSVGLVVVMDVMGRNSVLWSVKRVSVVNRPCTLYLPDPKLELDSITREEISIRLWGLAHAEIEGACQSIKHKLTETGRELSLPSTHDRTFRLACESSKPPEHESGPIQTGWR